MHEHFEHFFGFAFDPAPHDLDVNREIHIQLLGGVRDKPDEWMRLGAKFPASRLDDLLRALNHAKKVLETEAKKVNNAYFPRQRIF